MIFYGGNCSFCKGLNEPYMVTNSLWNKAFKSAKVTFCCLSCLESKISRKLTLGDFSPAPINFGIFGFDVREYLEGGKAYLDMLHSAVKSFKKSKRSKK